MFILWKDFLYYFQLSCTFNCFWIWRRYFFNSHPHFFSAKIYFFWIWLYLKYCLEVYDKKIINVFSLTQFQNETLYSNRNSYQALTKFSTYHHFMSELVRIFHTSVWTMSGFLICPDFLQRQKKLNKCLIFALNYYKNKT